MHYLLKTEPTAYSFADLLREKETDWTGVTNPTAVKNLRAMKKGDKLVIYHTGDEKAAVGLARVISVDISDPKVPLGSHRGRCGNQAAKNTGRDQAAAHLSGFPAGPPVEAFGRPTRRGPVRLAIHG